MLVSVKGTFRNGVAQPTEAVEGREGQTVIITFVEDKDGVLAATGLSPDEYEAAWDKFEESLKQCEMHTGIPDLAHEHDHYLHGRPKREP